MDLRKLIWPLVILGVLLLIFTSGGENKPQQPPFTQSNAQHLDKMVDESAVDSVNLFQERDGDHVFTYDVNGTKHGFTASPAHGDKIVADLHNDGVAINSDAEEEPEASLFGSMFSFLLPMLLFLGIWFFLMRRMQGGGGGGMNNFGKSKSDVSKETEKPSATFEDVAGVDEAKQDLAEVVEFLRDPSRFNRLGGKMPSGVLLEGPPGTGKTLLAKAVAGEANASFISVSGSEFVEMYVGVGASRVRDLFTKGKKHKPCIIFIDEIDAVGRARGSGLGGGNDEREQTLNQILTEMDGFGTEDGVFVVAATNRSDILDPALTRPGRFDRKVVVGLPDVKGREAILKVHARKVPLGPDVEMRHVAQMTPGMSGADLANLVNEAALTAARRNAQVVEMEDFNNAQDKIQMGAERRTMVMSDDEKRRTAYHEAGHALVGIKVPGNDPIHKATIVPRGGALGMVQRRPEGDRVSMTKSQIDGFLAMAYGGRVAELKLAGGDENQVTTGASNDMQQATDWAKRAVFEWGFGAKTGRKRLSAPESMGYLGRDLGSQEKIPEHLHEQAWEDIGEILTAAEKIATKVLEDFEAEWHAISIALIELETLTGQEIDELIKLTEKQQAGNAKDRARKAVDAFKKKRATVEARKAKQN